MHLETWELEWRPGLVFLGCKEGKEDANLCDSDFPLFVVFQNRGHGLQILALILTQIREKKCQAKDFNV